MQRLIRDIEGPALAPAGSVVAIGAFDGLHRGHQALLEGAALRARALALPSIALSFEPLPRQFFQGRDAVARLSRPRARIRGLLARVDAVAMLRFNAALASMTPAAFVERVIVARLNAREVHVGPGFRFGHQRAGDVAMLRVAGSVCGFSVHEIARVADGGERISATAIRDALARGDFAGARALLGRDYTMGGRVVHGQKLGRTLGYPTANLPIRHGRAPLHGIYAVRVDGAGLKQWPAVASLGTRPTVDGVEPLLEVHLFDFDGDLYGELLDVSFIAKLRDELRFDSLSALTEQMHRDAAAARAALVREVTFDEALTA